jgi:aspartyl-tRNA(Asn)/glutamyl-tRNA(Gln) amidotransferase subunit B
MWLTHRGYEVVIGLEVHVKLNSATKMFCACPNVQEFADLVANTYICPVCTGQPWALPVVQEEPLRKAVQLGMALWCTIQQDAYFERKSYFYPDLPMWFQITQLARPSCVDGLVHCWDNALEHTFHVGIRDAHIEHDTGKMLHYDGGVMIDYNRAWTPLVEIVTEPDFRSDDDVVYFLKELQRIIRFQGIGDGDLEKWQMRCDVNISLRPLGSHAYGTRTELKNLNSFSAIKRAIHAEMHRQAEVLIGGGSVDQETRGRDDATWSSYVMRSKADALDYRYFPEPDLPPLHVDDAWLAARRAELVQSPFAKIQHYKASFGFNKEYIFALIHDVTINSWFHRLLDLGHQPAEVARWFAGPLAKHLNQHMITLDQTILTIDLLHDFFQWCRDGRIADAHAKTVFSCLMEEWGSVDAIIDRHGLVVVDDSTLESILHGVLAEYPNAVADLHAGKQQAVGFLVGQCMKAAAGSGDPKRFKELIMCYVTSVTPPTSTV